MAVLSSRIGIFGHQWDLSLYEWGKVCVMTQQNGSQSSARTILTSNQPGHQLNRGLSGLQNYKKEISTFYVPGPWNSVMTGQDN